MGSRFFISTHWFFYAADVGISIFGMVPSGLETRIMRERARGLTLRCVVLNFKFFIRFSIIALLLF